MTTETSDLLIRCYRPTIDEPSSNSTVSDSHRSAYAPVTASTPTGDFRDLEHTYLMGDGEFLVGEAHGRVVAMGGIRRREGTTAELTRMRTHPAVQRRGYARALLHQLEHRATVLGYTHLWLVTGLHQQAAIALYRQHGYQQSGQSRQAGVDAVYMQKRL